MIKTIVTFCLVHLLMVGHGQPTILPKSISGIYPSLAYYNDEGECGTGAVVPWAGRLWVITYGPHKPFGSSDKLYEITPSFKQITRPESIGGTPANRMIHLESNQLFIGPYAIDAKRNVRVIPYTVMPGRHTGNARHLTDPTNKIYYGTMEEGFYEVDVNTLAVKTLYTDGNVNRKEGEMAQEANLLEGAHGKGLYSGQGVMVYSNNGEASKEALKQFDIKAGILAQWNGKDWSTIRRNQFVEVTGLGGIYGNAHPATDPVWSTGWDYKSILLGVMDKGKWSFFRLPKASHSYDGAHGWNTEWPRIRDVGTAAKPDYLMTMHGMFWRFPKTFTSTSTAGIRPRSAYLKVIGDYTRWNDQLVFGCDDAAHNEFLNKRTVKGTLPGPGQSNSNLWFTSVNKPDQLGPATAEGAVWLNEKVEAKQTSEPFLFTGWQNRSAWVMNHGDKPATFTFEADKTGNGKWSALKTVTVDGGAALQVPFSATETGEWVRVSPDTDTKATIHFYYGASDARTTKSDAMFSGLATVDKKKTSGGLLWALGDDRHTLGVVAGENTDGAFTKGQYYELSENMELEPKNDPAMAMKIANELAIPKNVVTIDEASVLITDDAGRRWRLPKGDERFTELTNNGVLRICREVATERDLLNCSGTFYELPAENADGFAKIRPVASHGFRINDYASYRGILVMTGIDQTSVAKQPHIIRSNDGKAAVWVGAIDDLWKLGKPVGSGGPWKNAAIQKGVPSDAYLVGFYNKRSLQLSHQHSQPVTFTIEADPVGNGPWMPYKKITVAPGQTYTYNFPDHFQSRWLRFVADTNCIATAYLEYR